MSNPQNEALVRRMIELLIQPNMSSDIDQVLSPNWVNNDKSLEAAMGYPYRGLDGFRQLHDFFMMPFSDLELTVEDIFSEGDWVACHFRLSGRNTGEFMGMPATGKTMDMTATGMFRCQNGKVVENIVNPDMLSALMQLGILQMPAQRKAA